jgi:hypothetical protein
MRCAPGRAHRIKKFKTKTLRGGLEARLRCPVDSPIDEVRDTRARNFDVESGGVGVCVRHAFDPPNRPELGEFQGVQPPQNMPSFGVTF